MITEKRPSIYSDRGTIGSADELDEYGVWVKSGPQDVSIDEDRVFTRSSLPDFEADPEYESSDFEAVDFQIPEIDLSEAESSFGEVKSGGTDIDISAADDGFDDMIIPESGLVSSVESSALETEDAFTFETEESKNAVNKDEPERQSDLSTQLLMKIADELSSIRTELSSLKKEFAGIRFELPAEGKTDTRQHGGFFSEEDDEKIALTGDEMDNILSTAEFTEETIESEEPDNAFAIGDTEEESGFAEADLSPEDTETAEPSASDAVEEEEEIEIDFDGLGIDLNIDPSDFDKAREENAEEQNLIPIEEESSPDMSFADMALDLAADGFKGNELEKIPEENLLDEDLTVEDVAEESLLDVNLTAEENLLDEDLTVEDGDEESLFDDDLTAEENMTSLEEDEISLIEEEPLEEEPFIETIDKDTISLVTSTDRNGAGSPLESEEDFDAVSLDLSEAVIDEPDLSGEITENPVEEPSLGKISLDGLEDINVELEDEPLELTTTDAEEEFPVFEEDETLELSVAAEDNDLAQVIPEGFEAEAAAESQVPFDDDLEGAWELGNETTADEELAGIDVFTEASEPVLDLGTSTAETVEEPVVEELDIPPRLKSELKTVLSYMDHLLESLPEEKIEEFAKSEYFNTYKKLFKELGLV